MHQHTTCVRCATCMCATVVGWIASAALVQVTTAYTNTHIHIYTNTPTHPHPHTHTHTHTHTHKPVTRMHILEWFGVCVCIYLVCASVKMSRVGRNSTIDSISSGSMCDSDTLDGAEEDIIERCSTKAAHTHTHTHTHTYCSCAQHLLQLHVHRHSNMQTPTCSAHRHAWFRLLQVNC